MRVSFSHIGRRNASPSKSSNNQQAKRNQLSECSTQVHVLVTKNFDDIARHGTHGTSQNHTGRNEIEGHVVSHDGDILHPHISSPPPRSKVQSTDHQLNFCDIHVTQFHNTGLILFPLCHEEHTVTGQHHAKEEPTAAQSHHTSEGQSNKSGGHGVTPMIK